MTWAAGCRVPRPCTEQRYWALGESRPSWAVFISWCYGIGQADRLSDQSQRQWVPQSEEVLLATGRSSRQWGSSPHSDTVCWQAYYFVNMPRNDFQAALISPSTTQESPQEKGQRESRGTREKDAHSQRREARCVYKPVARNKGRTWPRRPSLWGPLWLLM